MFPYGPILRNPVSDGSELQQRREINMNPKLIDIADYTR